MKCLEEMEQDQEVKAPIQLGVGVEAAAGAVGEVLLEQDRSDLAFALPVEQRSPTREGHLALSINAPSAEPP